MVSRWFETRAAKRIHLMHVAVKWSEPNKAGGGSIRGQCWIHNHVTALLAQICYPEGNLFLSRALVQP